MTTLNYSKSTSYPCDSCGEQSSIGDMHSLEIEGREHTFMSLYLCKECAEHGKI
jgi:hypothetical protein